MKTPNLFIKSLTLLLFISWMTGFIMLKSGCQKKLYEKVHPDDTRGLSPLYDEYIGVFDTLKVYEKPYYAVVEPAMPSSKMGMVIEPINIMHLIHEDSLGDDFVPSVEYLHPAVFSEWLKKKKEERKERKKGLKIQLDDGANEEHMLNSSKSFRGEIFKVEIIDSLDKDSL